MTEGRITLLYKGKGLDRALPASYRPITLLNTDYKLAARVLADRMGPLLNHVVDSTQTGFLPQRWIGDNILAHLDIIDIIIVFLGLFPMGGVQVGLVMMLHSSLASCMFAHYPLSMSQCV